MKNGRDPDPDRIRLIEEYTYEDYLSDFELDYLGFDGVPDRSVSDNSSEKIPINMKRGEIKHENGQISGNDHNTVS